MADDDEGPIDPHIALVLLAGAFTFGAFLAWMSHDAESVTELGVGLLVLMLINYWWKERKRKK